MYKAFGAFSVLFILLLSSCSNYVQIYTVNSNNVQKQNNEVFFENDTVKINYYFWAERGVLAFSIFNKLDKPLYIDWKKSAIIFNNLKFNYWFDAEEKSSIANYRGYAFYYSLNWRGVTYERKEKEERITFIPPKSKYQRWQYHIYKEGTYDILHTGLDEKSVIAYHQGNLPVTVKGYQFQKIENDTTVNSEQTFRNFLTFSLSEEISNEFYVDNSFFIKSIFEISENDFTNLSSTNFFKDDKFYINIPVENSVKYRKQAQGQSSSSN